MAHSFSGALFQCLTTLMGKCFSVELMRTSCFPAGGPLPLILSDSSLALSSLYPPLRQLQTTVRSPLYILLSQLPSFQSALLPPSFLTVPLQQPSTSLSWGLRSWEQLRAVNLLLSPTLIKHGSVGKGESGLQCLKPASVLAGRPIYLPVFCQ